MPSHMRPLPRDSPSDSTRSECVLGIIRDSELCLRSCTRIDANPAGAGLTNAYRTLANGGRWSPLRLTPGKQFARAPCRQEGCAGVFDGKAHLVFTPGAAFLVADILADRSARAGTFGPRAGRA